MNSAFLKKGLLLTLFLLCSPLPNLQAADSIIASKANKSLLLDVQQLSTGRLVAVGERGHILISDDNGVSWKQQPVPTRNNITAVDFYDDKWGVAVGYEQTILVTKDGGESWLIQHINKESVESPALFDVEFVSLNKIIAVGSYGLYLESIDGGDSWKSKEIDALSDIYGGFSHFYGITQKASSNTLYLVGEKYVSSESEDGEESSTGLLAISQDRGESWIKLNSPYDGSFFGVHATAQGRIFAYGLKGNLYQSEDQGEQWTKLALKTTSGIHDLEFSGENWFAVGTSGTLINGKDFSVEQRNDLKGRAALVALQNGQLLIVGEGGIELISTNPTVTSEQAQ